MQPSRKQASKQASKQSILAAVLALGLVAGAQASIGVGTYAEVGDAGDHLSPQDITGSAVSQITGFIGGTPTDPIDAFRFFWGGGNLAITATTPGAIEGTQAPLPLSLWDAAAPQDPVLPAYDPFDFLGTIGFVDLKAGNYIVQVCYPQDPVCPTSDPPFTISFFSANPDGSPTAVAATVSAPVPEPATLALLGVGLAALAASRQSPASLTGQTTMSFPRTRESRCTAMDPRFRGGDG